MMVLEFEKKTKQNKFDIVHIILIKKTIFNNLMANPICQRYLFDVISSSFHLFSRFSISLT